MEIRSLLDGIKNLEMVIPEFQREYVWNLEQAKQLMISFFKDYPTGCLLFWETNNPPEIKNDAVNRQRIGLTKVILDGQQRLTTLYLLITDEIPPYYNESEILNDPRHLYFNLESGDFQYYKRTLMGNNPLWKKLSDCFVDNINAFNILTNDLKISGNDENFMKLGNAINENLNKLKSILKKDYPVLTIPLKVMIDEAIDVFDRINSQGTKLTDAELVLTHIAGRWPQIRKKMKKEIISYKEKGFSFDLDFFTRCIVIALTKSALYESIKYDLYRKEDYEKAWNIVCKTFNYLIPILKQDVYVCATDDLGTSNILIPIIAHLINFNFKFTNENKKGFLYWMFLASIWSRYSGQTDQRLDKDVQIAINSQNPIKELIDEIIDQRGRVEVKPDDLEGKGAGHPLYKMLYVITKYKKAIDWSNGGQIYNTIGENYSIQSHHIFPQSLLYENEYNSENHIDKKLVNEIANRAFITRDTNFEILNKLPNIYLDEIQKKYPTAIEKQFIPLDKNLWNISNYKDFLKARRKIIAQEINNFLNEIKSQSSEVIQIINWADIINNGENNYVEFKAGLRYDLREKKAMPHIEHAIAKTICAFLNSEGGKLFIGVTDDKNIIGLENDLSILQNKNKDEFLLKFENIVKSYLGNEYFQYINVKFEIINAIEICIVEVMQSGMPVFLKHQGKEEFYIRSFASSQPLGLKETNEYIKNKWN
ncbi:DUF262 domain-containing protein [Candidatus Gracilibacteria bacterium]|nr:DUF262 domain-containing protein [Candidatus Gracilibacteria bacterium]